MRLRFLTLLGLLAAGVLAQSTEPNPADDFLHAIRPEPFPAPLAALVDQPDSARLAAHLAFLTDPARDGRGLGTQGLDATVRYLAAQLKALGIPSLGASYLQWVPLREVLPGRGNIRLQVGSQTFTSHAGKDAVLPAIAPGTLAGPLVFVGYGIQEPTLGHDDFRGVDVKGKVVLFLDGTPADEAWRKPDLLEKYASPRSAKRYHSRLALLEQLGARAAIALEASLERRIAARKEPILPTFLAAPGVPVSGPPPLARVALTPRLRAQLEADRTGTASLSIRGRVRASRGFNVLGKLEGSDPALRQETILLGAHMDHLGRPNGVLHPGADDNGSGVSALLEIARALATHSTRPRRTVLIAFWTGEEEGKFGSGHYTRQPRWALAATKAYLNLDMIGHPWTPAELQTLVAATDLKEPKAFFEGLDPAHFAEPGLSSAHRDLGPILLQAGRGTGMSLHLDWTDGKNGGSDYRDFARLGLPFVRFFGNYFPEYHQPGDTLDKLNPDQVRRMARLVLATAWLLADQ